MERPQPHVRARAGIDAQKKRRGFPRLRIASVEASDYGIVIAAPVLSYQYSFNVAGVPFGPVVVIFV